MAEYRKFVFSQLLVLIKGKMKYLIGISLSSMIISYICIYIFIPAEYESTVSLFANEDDVSSILKDIKSLPMGLGGKSKATSQTEIFKSIIYSRTNLDKIISKFDLMKDYNENKRYKAIKKLKERIYVQEEDGLFEVTVRAYTPSKAAEMVNYLVDEMNNRVVLLNVNKSRLNRVFLEKRFNEISEDLVNAEEKLKIFQKKTGIIGEVEKQGQIIVESIIRLESELFKKKIDYEIAEQTISKEAPTLNILKREIKEFEVSLNKLKEEGNQNSPFVALNNLPENFNEYLSIYRSLEIQTALLKYILPIYEQAKIDEYKDIPVLQIIDQGIPAEDKSYPQRSLFAFLITIAVVLSYLCFAYVKDNKVIDIQS